MKKLRKFLTVSVMVLSVIAMSGLVIAPKANASASAGDLIKMSGLSSVYYLGSDGKRYVFPNSTTYFSWYPDFSGVVTIPAAELQSYPLGGNVTMRPGTNLVKITTDPSVYAVTPNGVLSKIGSEAQAAALYGTNWSKRVVDVPDAFFTNYTIGTPLANGAVPAGSLVKSSSSASVYYYDGTNYRSIPDEATFNANRFSWSNVLTVSNAITAGGSNVTSSDFVNVAQNGGSTGVVVTGSGLMVSLNANTAASNTVVKGQALANLASFNFTAANDGSVNVTSVKIKRIGISSDSDVNNIYLYNGNTKLTDNGSFGNGYVTFSNSNGIFTVPAGQTVTITAKADMNGTTGNIGVAINAASDITASASTVSGSFPLNGNLMSESSATNLATVSIGTVTPTTATTINAGTMGSTVWSAPFNVTNKAVNLSYISFKQIGSISNDALANLTLFINGVQAGSAATIDSNTRVTFDLSNSPVTLNTGSNTVELRADVIKGSSRTYSFSLQTASDVVLTDTNYNINVAAANVPANGATTTINSGNISIALDPAFSATQVVKNASNVVLSRYTMKAYGEDIKVNTLVIAPSFTGTATNTEGINNLSLYVNGSQVGSSQNYIMTAGAWPANPSFGTNNLFTIPAGTTVTLEVRGDLNFVTNTQVTAVKADFASDTYQGAFSFNTGTNSSTAGVSLSVVSGNLVVSKNTGFQSQNVSQNTANQKIGSFIIQAGNAEAVRVTNLSVALGGTITDLTKLSNLYVSDNTNKVNPSTTNNFPVNFTLQPNQSHTVDVFADLGTISTGSTTVTSLTVTATGQSTNVSVGGSAVTGQTVTVTTGSLSAPTLVANTPSSMLIAGGTNNVAVATYKFVSTTTPATLNEVVFNVVGSDGIASNTTAISSISVGGVSAPVSCSGSVCQADITGLSIAIPSGLSGTPVAVTPTFNNVTSAGQGGAPTNNGVRLALVSYKSTIGSTQTTTSSSATSSLMVLVASVPTISLSANNPDAMTSGYAAGGASDVLHFTVANSNSYSPINLHSITVTPTWSGSLTSTSTQAINVYNASDLNTIIGTATSTASGVPVNIVFTADQTITSSQSYVVKADTTGLTQTGNSYRMDLTSNDTFGSGTAWQWNDGTIATYINGYLVKNLPLTGNTFVK